MQKNKKKIWLMGGSGSGKSTAAKQFSELGIEVVDADKISREILRRGETAFEEVIDSFGRKILTDDEINRWALGEIVFTDPRKLRILNEITHKYIKEELRRRADNAEGTIVFDAALPPDGFLECDIIVCVTAARELRIGRIMKRDGISYDAAVHRLNSQQDDDFYIAHSDFAFVNDADEQALKNQVKKWCLDEKII